MEIRDFGGIAPRIPEHAQGATSAHVAHDVKLRNNRLEAWREKRPLNFAEVSDAKTLVTVGCCQLTYDKCVTVTETKPDSNRIYVTGRVDYPEVAVLVNCIPQYFRLGIPQPLQAPLLNYTAVEIEKDVAARTYVYTFVNQFGEEGAPSYPSPSVSMTDGGTVEVSGFEIPAPEYAIVSIRLYRTTTSMRDGFEKEQTPQTDYLLVAEVPIDTAVIEDNREDRHLGVALATLDVREPHPDMRKLRRIEASNTFVGIHGNIVSFSENHQGYNYPVKQEYTLDHNAVNVVTVNDRVFVTTDGAPYVIDGSIICEDNKARLIEMADTRLPDIGCGYENSAIATPFGAVYSSIAGLVLIKDDATLEVITASWYSEDDWIELEPHTVRLAYWRGCLFCVTAKTAFILYLDEQTFKDNKLGKLVTISDRPVDLHQTRNGELMMLQDDIVYQWNAGSTYREYQWISRESVFPGRAAFTAAKVRTDDITMELYTKDTEQMWERKVVSEEPFRLPRIGRHVNWRVGFRGTGVVEFVKAATSVATLTKG